MVLALTKNTAAKAGMLLPKWFWPESLRGVWGVGLDLGDYLVCWH